MSLLRRRGITAAAGGGGAFADNIWDTLLSPSETVYVQRDSADTYQLLADVGRNCFVKWTIGVIASLAGSVTPIPHHFAGEITQYPTLTKDDKDASFTYHGTWTDFGGSHYSNTAGDYAEWVTPDGVTCIGMAPIRATNRGYALVSIDGDTTAANLLRTAQDEVDAGRLDASVLVANGGSLNPTDRVQNCYSDSSSIQQTMYADNLSAGVHTVRWTVTGVKQSSSTDLRVSVDTGYYGGATITMPTTSGVVWKLSKNVMSSGSVYEYAYNMRGPSGTVHWIGNLHGYEAETSLVIKVDGSPVTMTDGQILSGTEIQIVSARTQYHEDYSSASDPVGTGTCTYTFSQGGIEIDHTVDWAQALTPVTGYPSMMTGAELAGDVRYETFWRGSGNAIDHDIALDLNDETRTTIGTSDTAWMWSPGGNLVLACRAPQIADMLQDFAYSGTDKIFIDDRSTVGSLQVNKVYFPIMSDTLTIGTMPDVDSGTTWWGDTTYRVGQVTSADDLCARGLPT